MLFISLLVILVPLYNVLFEAKGKAFNLTPSYNTLIKYK